MHIIQVQIEGTLYDKALKSGVDIEEKFNEFLKFELIDDGYPAITTQEARSRVGKAVKDYQDGTGEYLTSEEYNTHRSKHIEKLKAKYAES